MSRRPISYPGKPPGAVSTDGRNEAGGQAMRVRRMAMGDAAAVAALSGQLGYPADEEAIRRRWAALDDEPAHAVFVAEAANGRAVGWVHVHERRLLEADGMAEVLGLVVDEGERGTGVGRRLVDEAERWSVARGCGSMRIASNVVRQEAHAFYQKLGYAIVKTQHAFRKELNGENRG